MRGLWLGLLGLLAAAPQEAGFRIPVQEFTLPNGMRILVVERHEVPRVFCSLWWRVGSVHERPGATGLSHFFEHMMFMGTDVIGTTDPRRDAELNAKIEDVMGRIREIKLARLESDRRGLPPDPALEERHRALWKEYEGYVDEQKKIIIPEHLSKIFQANGGTGLNATTSYDRTNFFVEMPANKVELFFWLESDRFLKPVFRSFYPEREVVKEERRMRTDSTPTGLIHESFSAMFWQSHPYRWPVLGWMSDIDQYTLADAERYYRTHYSPQNCTAIFVGDVRLDEVKELATRYFGRLKRSTVERDPIVTVESEQVAERRLVAEANSQDELTLQWHGPSGVHRDSAPCDLLMNVLGGRSGRLYRPLVEEKKLALEVQAGYESRRYGGSIVIDATPREGADPAELERAIESILEEVQKNGVTDRELAKARNQQLADLVRTLKTNQGVTHQLGYFETIGTYHDFDGYVRSVETATAADLKRCAEQYLKPSGRNILVIRRKGKK
ncbi:MAG TPA: pitrilysin family protein [Planctomycetota bacterium]|nr:pitrilysin family protein [Planctomycetota bacterium]